MTTVRPPTASVACACTGPAIDLASASCRKSAGEAEDVGEGAGAGAEVVAVLGDGGSGLSSVHAANPMATVDTNAIETTVRANRGRDMRSTPQCWPTSA